MKCEFVGKVFPEQEVKEDEKFDGGAKIEEELRPVDAAESSTGGAVQRGDLGSREVKEKGEDWEIVDPPPTYGEAMRHE